MKNNTFIKVTNTDIYNSLQDLHKKQERMFIVLKCQETKIKNLSKIVWTTIGSVLMIGSSTILYVLKIIT